MKNTSAALATAFASAASASALIASGEVTDSAELKQAFTDVVLEVKP